ncbi:MAG: hypothetical protein U0547_13590 [Dehalococcoidia bacterium]
MEPVHRKARRQPRVRGHRPPSRWEPVWEGDSEAAASIVAGRLDADGFRTQVVGGRATPGGYPHAFQRATWAILVRSGEAPRARDLLRDRGESDNIVTAGSGALDASGRATLRVALQVVVVLALVIAIGELLSHR